MPASQPKSILASVKDPFLSVIPAAAAVLAVSFVLTIGVAITARVIHSPLSRWIADPASFPGMPVYFGSLTFVGVWGWAAAAAVCLFTAAAIAINRGRSSSTSQFFLVSGLLTFLLGMDDTFLLHEKLIPHFLHIPELFVLLIYIFLAGVYFAAYRKTIMLETRYFLLAGAVFFFVLAMGLNILDPHRQLLAYLEGCFKLTGILFWLAYFVQTGLDTLRCPPNGAEKMAHLKARSTSGS